MQREQSCLLQGESLINKLFGHKSPLVRSFGNNINRSVTHYADDIPREAARCRMRSLRVMQPSLLGMTKECSRRVTMRLSASPLRNTTEGTNKRGGDMSDRFYTTFEVSGGNAAAAE